MAKGKQKNNMRVRMKSGQDIFFNEKDIDRVDIPNITIKNTGKRNRLVLECGEGGMDKALTKELKKKGLL